MLMNLKNYLQKLLQIIKREKPDNQSYCENILLSMIYTIDSDIDENQKNAIILDDYNKLYPPHRGLTDFYINAPTADEIVQSNKELSKIDDDISLIINSISHKVDNQHMMS